MKRFIAIVLIMAIMCLMSGCGLKESGEYMKQTCTQMLDAIIAGDADTAYALMSEATSRGAFDETFDMLHADLDGAGEYTLRFRKLNRTEYSKTGDFTVVAVYSMKCDAGVFEVEMEDTSLTDSLEYFSITQVR